MSTAGRSGPQRQMPFAVRPCAVMPFAVMRIALAVGTLLNFGQFSTHAFANADGAPNQTVKKPVPLHQRASAERPTEKPVVRMVKQRPASGPIVQCADGYMAPFEIRIPNSNVRFRMLPIPGRAATADHPAIEPFWIGQYEVTWPEYFLYMQVNAAVRQLKRRQSKIDWDDIDAVTAPSMIYDPDYRFRFAKAPRSPATSMTLFAARQYTKWLSKTCPFMYRLPTEAEWEHACRADSRNDSSADNRGRDDKARRWFFGDDPRRLNDFAVFRGSPRDSSRGAEVVGTRKPNPWGLYDIHGNVAEWVLRPEDVAWTVPKPTERFEPKLVRRVARGGSWRATGKGCEIGWRWIVDESLWSNDPQIPFSPWWLADPELDGTIGFRLVCPLGEPDAKSMEPYWRPGSSQARSDVEVRLKEGRGAVVKLDAATVRRLNVIRASEENRPPPWDK